MRKRHKRKSSYAMRDGEYVPPGANPFGGAIGGLAAALEPVAAASRQRIVLCFVLKRWPDWQWSAAKSCNFSSGIRSWAVV